MVIESIPAQMTVAKENPSFEVDWQAVRSQSGLKQPVELAQTTRNKAYGKTLDAISGIVQDNNYLGEVEHPGNRVAQLAKNSTHIRTQTETNIGLTPQTTPDVSWTPGSLEVSWSRHKLLVEWDTEYLPEFTVDPPYSVEIFLRDKPHIKIYIADGEDPYMAGRVVDVNL